MADRDPARRGRGRASTPRRGGTRRATSKAEGAQVPTRRACGTMEVHYRLLAEVPGYAEARNAIQNHAWRSALSPLALRTGCTEIPVVVHVVYNTTAQNIPDGQIQSQIAVLNADYRKTNADVSTAPAAFQPLADDARVQFKLATTDPNGNATNGITRTQTSTTSFSQNDGVKSAASGGADPWPSDRYLNIWVCPLGGGLLGYAQFPGGPAATDGVVILHSGFGTTGTAAAPFNLGRTATHEVGHWLDLHHIWGDDGTGCFGSDFVADTPNQGGPNYGVPAFPTISCSNGPNGDMFMNYMDYVDDAAMVMFTTGQVTRMQAALDGARATIGTSIPCGKSLPKDLPKDLVKEPHKDLPKDNPKDLIKELPKDPPKDWPKDPPKDWPKDPPKEFPKDLGKDRPKDLIKDFPKDPPKDLPKDNPKDLVKENPKDLAKDPALEPPKNFSADLPPKAFSDPPKAFMEPPPDFPGIFGQPGLGGGGVPFVLATPGAIGGGGARADAGLAAGYLELIGQFAKLHARGLLDSQGMAAWQQAIATYQQLAQGTGASG